MLRRNTRKIEETVPINQITTTEREEYFTSLHKVDQAKGIKANTSQEAQKLNETMVVSEQKGIFNNRIPNRITKVMLKEGNRLIGKLQKLFHNV